jgi:tetratricopeptide (TPR) repeat protein
VRWRLVLAVLAAGALGCTAPSDRERTGDRAYAAGRYEEALALYQDAARGGAGAGRLWAKVGAAATRANKPLEAVDAYLRLAGEDPSRSEEAADGIENVARGAERAGDGVTLQAAVAGLRAIAPNRRLGGYVLALVRAGRVDEADLPAVLPAAMAAAPDAETMDSLVAAYGAAFRRAGTCDQAVLAYRAALRRGPGGPGRDSVKAGLADCAVRLGEAALGGGTAATALGWFAEAAQFDSSSVAGRRALVGIGRARAVQGDTVGAALAFQAAVTHSEQDDSIRQAAAAQLQALGRAPTPGDSVRTGSP